MRGLRLDTDAPTKSGFNLAIARILGFFVLLSTTAFLLATHEPFFSFCFKHTPSRSGARDFARLPVSCPAQLPGLAPPIAFAIPSPEDPERDVYTERLRGAVRFPTETFDGAPTDGADAWYDKFYKFEGYLKETFPDVFAALTLEHFATHGLLLTWKGSDASLQPIVLMAHQDTVPVPESTLARWTHPPFAGDLDDEGWIWGRGTSDCKNLVIAHLSAVSALLAADFTPTRTVHVTFGFDEEGGGVHSARAIAAHLEDVYGLGSLFLIVDEGGGLLDRFGRTWVAPSTGEKGSVNVKVSVNVPGGHSSIPPAHTAIGILSALVTTIEAHPPPVVLSAGNPFSTFAICAGEHGTTIDAGLKTLLAHERTWPAAAALLAERDAGDAARLSTTQAVDIVGGGLKVNALPEEAHAIVNHRVSVDDSIPEIFERYVALLSPEARKFNLSVVGFGEDPPVDETRYLQLSSPYGAEASPVTPAVGSAWEVFAGTSRHFYPDALVAPYLSTGGTDTRSYVNLTQAIFRFQAVHETQRFGTHTVDERVHVDGHLNAIAWVHALIQNADAFRE
ncbi:hypothetical protein B0H11DRAFT_2111863 [Mycena galericulata]|nr:hypothetical protein B0H11DRAFT_2111863 [Mycena galericulata]